MRLKVNGCYYTDRVLILRLVTTVGVKSSSLPSSNFVRFSLSPLSVRLEPNLQKFVILNRY